ncbi:MAG TPA: hypothetical protein VLK27_11610 [Chthoniobacterales bacterium]|nr:hypothetical protein [Chthoniobacterales bacterium]
MKTYICILAGAVLLAACEQKTETISPAPSPAPTPITAPEAEASPSSTSPSEAAANAAEPVNSLPPDVERPTATPLDTNQTGSWASPTPTP